MNLENSRFESPRASKSTTWGTVYFVIFHLAFFEVVSVDELSNRSLKTNLFRLVPSERGDLQQFDDYDQEAVHSTGGKATLEDAGLPWLG